MAILPARKSSLKRKHHSNSKLVSRKKQRKEVNSFNDLPWRTVSRPNGTGFEGDDGVLELEEVDGVEVVYEETENGRIAKLKVIAEEDDVLSLEGEDEKDDDGSSEADEADAPAANELVEEDSEDDDFDGELLGLLFMQSIVSYSLQIHNPVKTLLPNWSPFPLHPHLLSAVHKQNFTTPTPIQSASLPPALKGKDVIGVAQTVSLPAHPCRCPPLAHFVLRNISSVLTGIRKDSGIRSSDPTLYPITPAYEQGREKAKASNQGTHPCSHTRARIASCLASKSVYR